MASFTLSSPNLSIFSSSSLYSSTSAPSQLLGNKKLNQSRLFRVSCNAASDNNIDRRNVLLGLGGLYGVANLAGGSSAAAKTTIGGAIETPELSKCHFPTDLPRNADVISPDTCCPPVLKGKIEDYKLPVGGPARKRMPAHLATPEQIKKYETALAKMKSLDPNHPHSFAQIAKVHCAYCNDGYQQEGFSAEPLQVHFSWLFFPFHRWYLYFYEKILGKLIDDETFALPYWNWDIEDGYAMPAMFMNTSSSLYNGNRNKAYFPPVFVDLNYAGKDRGLTNQQLKEENNAAMYRTMVTNATTADNFLGARYFTGSAKEPGMGSVENIPHTPIHRWVGSPDNPNGEDMGNFYSAGRDPLFYAHHANVDRMWVLWRQLGGKDFSEDSWLNASFIFYDENEKPVRVYVKDTLDSAKMGYVYDYSPIPWLTKKPAPPAKKTAGAAAKSTAPFVTDVFPVALDKVVQVKVQRSKVSRTKADKNKEEEVLVIGGINVAADQYARFDVYLNDSDEPTGGKDKAQYVGGFAHLPQKTESNRSVKTSVRLGLNEPLEDLGAEDDDTVLVTLAPQVGGGVIKVDKITIEYSAKY